MKSYLLYPDRDYVRGEVLEGYKDLWFDTIINHLCVYDKYIKDIYLDSKNLMSQDPIVIKYRQDILKDFIKNKDVVINLYQFINELLTEFYNERFEMMPKHVTASYQSAIRISKRLTMALENMNRYYALFHPAAEGGYNVEFPDCECGYTEGDTLEEALDMAEDLISAILAGGSIIVTIALAAFVCLYAAIGQAVFYRDAKAEVEAGGSAA